MRLLTDKLLLQLVNLKLLLLLLRERLPLHEQQLHELLLLHRWHGQKAHELCIAIERGGGAVIAADSAGVARHEGHGRGPLGGNSVEAEVIGTGCLSQVTQRRVWRVEGVTVASGSRLNQVGEMSQLEAVELVQSPFGLREQELRTFLRKASAIKHSVL